MRIGSPAVLLLVLMLSTGCETTDSPSDGDAPAVAETAGSNPQSTGTPPPKSPGTQTPEKAPEPKLIFGLDLSKVVGKSESEIAELLGPPSAEGTTKNKGRVYPQHYYLGEKVEIAYVNGAAEWITVYGLESVPFSASSMKRLGLKLRTPTFQNDYVKRWERQGGVREVSMFPTKNKRGISYVYVVFKTRP